MRREDSFRSSERPPMYTFFQYRESGGSLVSDIGNAPSKSLDTRRVVVTLATFVLILMFPVLIAQGAPRYVCDDDICDPARRAYAEFNMNRACTLKRALSRHLDRRRNLEQALARDRAAELRCLRLHPWRGCWHHRARIRARQRSLILQQQRIDRIVARVGNDCDRFLPHPHVPNPADCGSMEASKYCPITSADQALQSIATRCDDLTMEVADALLQCAPKVACVLPAVRRHLSQANAYSRLAANAQPSCVPTTIPSDTPPPAPTATATVTATPSPSSTNYDSCDSPSVKAKNPECVARKRALPVPVRRETT